MLLHASTNSQFYCSHYPDLTNVLSLGGAMSYFLTNRVTSSVHKSQFSATKINSKSLNEDYFLEDFRLF